MPRFSTDYKSYHFICANKMFFAKFTPNINIGILLERCLPFLFRLVLKFFKLY